ncbi:MAG: TM2 domain-containing protein [Lachnospiraceae bacterium]|nr:TM2 domain-containing protein [Lachnospiraceae bacterium]
MLLMFFTGAFGGHRFYAKQYGLGVLYLLTCWTGFSLAMTVIDVLEFIPFPVDENGNIYV